MPRCSCRPAFHAVALAVAACCAALLCGCHRPVCYRYQAVDGGGWSCTDTLRFTLPSLPRAGCYTFSVGARATSRYGYQDLWLVLERRWGEAFRERDTVCLVLADADGDWRQGSLLHEQEAVVTMKDYTPRDLPLELLVYHVMPVQRLAGLREVGVKVE